MNKAPKIQLDSYSAMIASKYFVTEDDYVNLICVNSKFQCTLDKFHFNPIPVSSKKLFPNLQTQYLYNKNDVELKEVHQYVVWYPVSITQSKFDDKQYKNIVLKKEDIPMFFNLVPSNYNSKLYSSPDNLILPTILKGIGKNCFEKVGKLTSIIIPTNISFIDNKAFSYKTALKSLTIPNGVTRLGEGCFSSCNQLKSIVLPSLIKSLPDKCFQSCKVLNIQQLPTTITSIGKYCFSDTYVNLTSLPNNITSLSEGCFMYNNSIQSLTLSTNIVRIEDSCFFDCSLTSIQLSNSLTSIGGRCFKRCIFLKSITIPSLISVLPSHCFEECNSLSSIILPSSLLEIHDYCFHKCTKLSIVTIPTSVTSIGEDSFYKTNALSYIPKQFQLEETTVKVLLLGSNGSGKEALQKRFAENFFSDDYIATLEITYNKRVTLDKFRVNVQTDSLSTNIEEYMWVFQHSSYYLPRHCDCCLICFSLCDNDSFNEVDHVYELIQKQNIIDSDNDSIVDFNVVPTMLVGCKADLTSERIISKQDALLKAKKYGIGYCETSSLIGVNVDTTFESIIRETLKNRTSLLKKNKDNKKKKGKNGCIID
ncbi:hypothetical protein QTN25_006081 [Entamoeba marina]